MSDSIEKTATFTSDTYTSKYGVNALFSLEGRVYLGGSVHPSGNDQIFMPAVVSLFTTFSFEEAFVLEFTSSPFYSVDVFSFYPYNT